ncbi:MAG: phosphate ABC transporter permease PstA [Planctomycetes bacterium]|nr:phosphate ABC transporter permease PstA [Planctomycetota bacterium]MCB9909885.1 phosphate ABC transporter permease PstA [Planctomycetota bacterium]MCB9913375.1 phosphate ABC transporter permease PstA [Planctomycetota bacterium]HPF13057.1 phosphate ABC transporter permease PstA [Planctomycetota bacterium]HRV79900.1 phosphate ABC transporter permease PstA [Planctomycetota bacterium]
MSQTPEQQAESAKEIRDAMRVVPQVAHGEPAVWLAGGALAMAVLIITGMVGLIVYQGGRAFWPDPIAKVRASDGSEHLGEIQQVGSVPADEANGGAKRVLLRSENFRWSGSHASWIVTDPNFEPTYPEWAVLVELMEEGRIIGQPTYFRVDGKVLESDPASVWAAYNEHRGQISERTREIERLTKGTLAKLTNRQADARLNARKAELEYGTDSAEHKQALADMDALLASLAKEQSDIDRKIADLEEINHRYEIGFLFQDGTEVFRPMADINRMVPANRLTLVGRLGVYLDRWREFLTEDPRHANSQGGIWPALFGTVVMTMIMSIMVVPFGVLAALYLKEYAKPGFFVSLVRIAVNNLAGVPSIVFGVFGLSFFCYIVGAQIDEWFFTASLPNPTFGKGGILWASLTLALLTLPVVIVATEEALSAVPQSMREGSYGCGATRWQTIQRVVLPRALPGIMTGMILAIARGAGEVAPLMLVGAVKMTQDLPIDLSQAPYLFPQRSFMHLGFHIYDLGFQSQDSEAARPMVFATTLLLIGIVVGLNLGAIWLRARLRRRFRAAR